MKHHSKRLLQLHDTSPHLQSETRHEKQNNYRLGSSQVLPSRPTGWMFFQHDMFNMARIRRSKRPLAPTFPQWNQQKPSSLKISERPFLISDGLHYNITNLYSVTCICSLIPNIFWGPILPANKYYTSIISSVRPH